MEATSALLKGDPGLTAELLETRIAGRPLLQRHLLALQRAGVKTVDLSVHGNLSEIRRVAEEIKLEGIQLVVRQTSVADETANGHRFIQDVKTLVDPRLYRELIQMSELAGGQLVAVDKFSDNPPAEAKSPYRVGVPETDEVRVVDAQAEQEFPNYFPIGIRVGNGSASEELVVEVGRYYWHRIEEPGDAVEATTKVLLATMKTTDGIYARTNRRVSLKISRLLMDTPVTPNMATIGTLFCSMGAGLLFSLGGYPSMSAGAFLSWFASMLDGVDGELARARFQESDLGCWLEMVCDYLYYVFVFAGIGVGLYRSSGGAHWLVLGFGSVAAVLLSFWLNSLQRRQYSREGKAADFGLAYQRTVERRKKNPIFRFIRVFAFFATRAALPYFIFFFTVTGLAKLLMVLIFVGTNLTWPLLLYSSRLSFSLSKR